ncbi:MAG: choice-of-anchor L domain-containing protein [Bacteroidia bacterium]
MNHSYLRHYLFIFLLFSSTGAFSQAITVDTSANWQQSISSILGGNCVQISNVQFTNNPGSAAYFSQGDEIGLAEGIVLSSGSLGPFLSVADTFLNESFSPTEGDSLLEQYALQELGYTGNATSYDASRLQFNFISPVDQEVTIRFVFASEEYPEFAPPNNSFFNDIFAFFVKEADSIDYENIAVVPGTNLPVTIGNINAITNSEFYLESLTTGIPFAFDGYTTPLTATFTAQAGVMYHMIIAISDIGDSAFDTAVFLELAQTGSQSVHGKAYFNEEPLVAADVNLYGFNTEPGAFDAVGLDVTDPDGKYSIEDVEQGLYIVHVVPNIGAYPDALPVYFPGVVLWEDAVGVGVACDSLDVDGPGMIFITGPGEISGTIGQDPFGGKLRSDDLIPYEGVNVFLQDSASLEWRGFDVTDVLGEYTFNNLGYGTYYVYPDVAGIPILEARKVVINELSPSAEGINFQMNEDGVLDIAGNQQIALIDTGSNVEWTVSASLHYFDISGYNMKLRLGADTLINDTLYTSIWADGIMNQFDVYNEDEAIIIGGFRQLGSKLYLRMMNPNSPIDNRDILYFDSNLQVGDTLHYPTFLEWSFTEDAKSVIISRDTFELNGINRIRWELESLNDFSFENEMFISGIGNSKGLFNLGAIEGLHSPWFANLCYTDANGNSNFAQDIYSVYENYNLDVCFLITGSIDENESSHFDLYPNPGQSGFTIKQEKFEKAEIFVRDLSGREHLRTQLLQDNQSFQLDFLDAGVYLIELRTSSGTSTFVRWIKQ